MLINKPCFRQSISSHHPAQMGTDSTRQKQLSFWMPSYGCFVARPPFCCHSHCTSQQQRSGYCDRSTLSLGLAPNPVAGLLTLLADWRPSNNSQLFPTLDNYPCCRLSNTLSHHRANICCIIVYKYFVRSFILLVLVLELTLHPTRPHLFSFLSLPLPRTTLHCFSSLVWFEVCSYKGIVNMLRGNVGVFG
jgi:hypothetical protein